MSTNNTHERKRIQNKLSQRKHRQKQQVRLKELEAQVQVLTGRLNNCLHKDKSKEELKGIYDQSLERINKIYADVGELKAFLDMMFFGSVSGAANRESAQLEILSSSDQLEEGGDDLEEDDLDDITGDLIVPGQLDVTDPLGDVLDTAVDSTVATSNKQSKSSTMRPVDIDSHNAISDELLRFYRHNTKQYLTIQVRGHMYNSETVVNNVCSQFITTIGKVETQIEIPSTVDLLNSATILKMVCSYANEIFEKVPKFQNYTFALGGVKWLCGEILLLCMSNPFYESLINSVLFNTDSCNFEELYSNLQETLKNWLNVNRFNKAIDVVARLNSNDLNRPEIIEMMNFNPILHQLFLPTALQSYLIRQNPYEYPHWINFVIFPEFRDSILSKWDTISCEQRDIILNELLDKVVLRITDEATGVQNIFYMAELSTVLNYTLDCINLGLDHNDETLINPSIFKLQKNGLFDPKLWKVSRSYGLRFENIIPNNLVLWDIDDTIPQNVLRPQYNPLI